MEIWKSLSGMLLVEITSAEPEKILDAATQAKIPLFQVKKKGDLTFHILIQRKKYPYLERIIHQRADHIQILQKKGLYWKVYSFLHCKVLFLCFLFLLLLSVFLPSRILFISVVGNTSVPDNLILAAAEDSGLHFGASRKMVRNEHIKNALLSDIQQLQWVGVNTSGCTAVISVLEQKDEHKEEEDIRFSNLIADVDGYILSVTITGGTCHVVPGNTVKEGEILVSGYTDCGNCIQVSRAAGEIFAQTNRQINAVMPDSYLFPLDLEDTVYRISIVLGKKRINLWKDSRISTASCGRMYQEYFVSLPGTFQLPIAICVDQYQIYNLHEATESENYAKNQLQQFSKDYLNQQMVAGCILSSQDQLAILDDLYLLNSRYTCTEMIGREQREQIGVFNGKRN